MNPDSLLCSYCLWSGFLHVASLQRRPSSPKSIMHIACSPYFSKIYKFRPYFRSVLFLGFPPALTMMHLVIILYMYWRLLLELYGPGCHSVTGPSDRPQNPQTDLKTLRPTSGPSDRPQDPQMDFRTLRPTSGLSDRPQDPQTDLTTLRPTSSII